MKKYFLILSVFVLILFQLLEAQPIDTTFQKRSFRQQLFALEYIKVHKPPQAFNSPLEIDTYFKEFIKSWKVSMAEEEPLLSNLDPYASIWLLRMSMGVEAEQAMWARCHVFREYMIPSFMRDFDHYSQDISLKNSYLIYWPAIDWMVNPLFCHCDLPLETWDKFNLRLAQLAGIMDKYLSKNKYGDENQKRVLEQTGRVSLKNRLLFSIRNDIYHSQLDAAFAGLAAACTEEFGSYYLIPLGKKIADAYLAEKDTSKALATMDLLARSFSEADLTQDSLKKWYLRIDPVRGADRFSLMSAANQVPVLVESTESFELSGSYIDLQSGQLFDLASLKGEMVILDFWATWCGPCLEEIPHLKKFIRDKGKHFRFISISSDAVEGGASPSTVKACMAKHGIDYQVLYDDPENSLTKKLKIAGWPSMFLINEEGNYMVPPLIKNRYVLEFEELETYFKRKK